MDGAYPSDIPHMLNSVNEFQDLSRQLAIDDNNRMWDESIIADCRKFYPAYRDYLQSLHIYANFEEYLIQNEIEY